MVSKQDGSRVRTAEELERKYNLAGMQKATRLHEEGLNKTQNELEEFVNSTMKSFADMQTQIDGSITTYYHNGVPTLLNYPANEWKPEEYAKHVGTMYYDKDTGHAYRFFLDGNTYVWERIINSDVEEALKVASTAQDTADGKRRVFVTTPFVPYDEGDLWLNNKELYVCVNAKVVGQTAAITDFEKAVKYTDDSALQSFISGDYADDLNAIKGQVDKKSETWYQAADPSSAWTTADLKSAHVGDLWYNTTAKKSYMYGSDYKWAEADGVPDSVYDRIDKKAQIFADQPVPPYYEKDLYVQGTNGEILVCTTTRETGNYNASDWVKASKYTDDSGLNSFISTVFKETVDSLNGLIDGKITTWYYKGVPTLSNLPASQWNTAELKLAHVGDLYYDKDTGYVYRFNNENNVYSWGKITDKDVTESLSIANSAQDTADSKRRIFTVTPAPPYDNGDLWIKDQEIYVCQISKPKGETFADVDFIIATKYTDDTVATEVGGKLEVIRGTVLEVQKSADNYKIELETQIKEVDANGKETAESLEKMTYQFGTDDLSIANSNDPVNARINNQGLRVFNYNTLQAIFNHRGTGVQKLIVVGSSQLGNLSIVKGKDENGYDCTDINYLVSKVQKLTDLEGSE